MEKVVFILIILTIAVEAQNPIKHENQKWRHPNKMFDVDIEDHCTCDFSKKIMKGENINPDIEIYYKRLVKFLFNRQSLQHDPSTRDFVRNVPIKITQQQLMDLEDATNVREMDSIVSEIMTQSKTKDIDITLGILLQTFYEQKVQNALQSVTSKLNQVLLGLSALLFVYLIYRNFFISRPTVWSILSLFILIIFGISYAMSYNDCLRDLETEQLIRSQMSQDNPCENLKKTGYLDSMKRLITGSSEKDCHQYLKENLKPLRTYCDPLEVTVIWAANLKVKYLRTFLGHVIEMTSELTNNLGLMQRVIIWPVLFLGICLVCVVIYIFFLKYGFQYASRPQITRNDSEMFRRESIETVAPKNAQIVYIVDSSKIDKKELIKVVESSVEIVTGDTTTIPQLKQIEANPPPSDTENDTNEFLDAENENDTGIHSSSNNSTESSESPKKRDFLNFKSPFIKFQKLA